MWDAEDAQSIGPPQSGALQVSVPLTSFHLPHRYALLLPSSKMWPMQRGAGSCPRSRGSWLIPSIAQRRWLSGRSTPRTSTIVGRKSDVIAVDHDSLFPLTTAGHEITPGTRCPVRTIIAGTLGRMRLRSPAILWRLTPFPRVALASTKRPGRSGVEEEVLRRADSFGRAVTFGAVAASARTQRE